MLQAGQRNLDDWNAEPFRAGASPAAQPHSRKSRSFTASPAGDDQALTTIRRYCSVPAATAKSNRHTDAAERPKTTSCNNRRRLSRASA
jgi:hypothetical protein